MKNNKGFSLVELIVVIAIMAILAAVAIPTFAGFIGKANQAADVSFMNDLEYAIELAHAKDATSTLKSIVVDVDDDGAISEIKYTMNNGVKDTEITIKKGGTDDVSTVVDWDYSFKAVAKDTHEANENWSESWTVQ